MMILHGLITELHRYVSPHWSFTLMLTMELAGLLLLLLCADVYGVLRTR